MTVQSGVYLGYGPTTGIPAWPAFTRWNNGVSPTIALEFGDSSSLANMQSSAAAAIPAWADFITQMAAGTSPVSITLEFSVPLPADATLADGAAGAYATNYAAIGQLFVTHGMPSPILRPLWEANLSASQWYGLAAPITWIDCFQKIVGAFRSVAGFSPKIHWCSNYWSPSPTALWPGAGWVDYVGMDIYDSTWQGATPAARWAAYERALNLMAAFARQASVNKPMAIGEFGVGGTPLDAEGPGDNPLFVTNLAAWAKTNAAFLNYWNVNSGGYSGMLSGGAFPLSGAAFLAAFG